MLENFRNKCHPIALTPLSPLFLSLGLLLCTVIYFPVQHFDFLYLDDDGNLYGNPLFQAARLSHLIQFWTHPYFKLYIPTTYSVWYVLGSALGWASQSPGGILLDPGAFHAMNVVFHFLNFILARHIIEACLKKLLPELTRPAWTAWIAALFFLVHPVQVEAVAWVSGFKDVLSTTLGFSSILLYLRALDSEATSPLFAHKRYFFLSLLAGTLAALAKPSWIIFPVFLLILAIALYLQKLKTLWIQALLWLAPTGFVLWMTHQSQSTSHRVPQVDLIARPWIALDSLGHAILKFLLPLHLMPDYGRTPERVLELGIGSVPAWVGLSAVLSSGVLLVYYRGRPFRIALGSFISLFCLGLLPVLGILPFAFQRISTVADRYSYFPILWLCGSVSVLPHFAPKRWQPWIKRGLVIVILILTAASSQQTQVWKNNETLFGFALTKNPESFISHTDYGLWLDSQKRFAEALEHYQKSLSLYPEQPEVLINAGIALYELKRPDATFSLYREVLDAHPDFHQMRLNLGAYLVDQKRPEEGLQEFRKILSLDPGNADAYYAIAITYMQTGQIALAEEAFHSTLKLNPDHLKAQNELRKLKSRIHSSSF